MRIRGHVLGLMALLLGAGLLSGAAQAQGLFQSLFGWGSSSSPPKAAKPKASSPGPMSRPVPSLRSLNRMSPYGSSQWGASEEESGESFMTEPAQMGGYRTMCVRLCDGYYWPIRSSASESQFYRDAKLCESSCNCEAKLFYLPRSSDNVAHMTDLTGRSYGSLETAFKYRKKLSKSCTCKPVPWSQAEVSRHRVYAIMDVMKKQELRIAAEKKAADEALAKARAKQAEADASVASVSAPAAGGAGSETPTGSGQPATGSPVSGEVAEGAPETLAGTGDVILSTEGALETASASPSALMPMEDIPPAAAKIERREPTAKRSRSAALRAVRRQRVATDTGVYSGFQPGLNW